MSFCGSSETCNTCSPVPIESALSEEGADRYRSGPSRRFLVTKRQTYISQVITPATGKVDYKSRMTKQVIEVKEQDKIKY
jgi:hypothetical protein